MAIRIVSFVLLTVYLYSMACFSQIVPVWEANGVPAGVVPRVGTALAIGAWHVPCN